MKVLNIKRYRKKKYDEVRGKTYTWEQRVIEIPRDFLKDQSQAIVLETKEFINLIYETDEKKLFQIIERLREEYRKYLDEEFQRIENLNI